MATLICGAIQIPNIRAVVFDKDGTLADSRPFLKQLVAKRMEYLDIKSLEARECLMAAFGYQDGGLSPEGLMAVGSRHENLVVAAGYLAQTGFSWLAAMQIAESAFQKADDYMGDKTNSTPPYPGTVRMLSRFASKKIPLCVLSGDTPNNVEAFLERFELREYFDCWRGTSRTDPPKPDPTLMLELCHQLQILPSQVAVVGDSSIDRQMAQAAKIGAFISVSKAWGSSAVDGADAVLESWDNLDLTLD